MNSLVDHAQFHDQSSIAIIGAGPYGLAIAAHLRAAEIPFRIFGDALAFWRLNMPAGMKLRSPWTATHIAAPKHRHTLDDYYRQAAMDVPDLLPLEKFVDYGLWFQQRVAPNLDTRAIKRVDALDGGFCLRLEDGDSFLARRLVIATGLLGHEHRPPQFEGLPSGLVSHSCEHTESDHYRGKRVAVIGRGQSACESAALLHEAGADVEIISRGNLTWNADPGRRGFLAKTARAMLGQMLVPPSQVGPFPYNWINETPGVIRHFPQDRRDQWNERNLRANAITWLRPRLKDIAVDQNRRILAARNTADGVSLTLDNSTKRFDHVLLATGYRIDVARIGVLAPKLREKITQHAGMPVLNAGFESSVSGLHFVGAAAVASFGPLLRFIAGAGFAARRVTGAVLRNRARILDDQINLVGPMTRALDAERERS